MADCDYQPFVGIEYAGRHGCFRLVAQIYDELYGQPLGPMDAGLSDSVDDRVARLMHCLTESATEVTGPREGDLVLIRSTPWHIALVIDPPWMLHTYLGGASVPERWDDIKWRNRVHGFYRPHCGSGAGRRSVDGQAIEAGKDGLHHLPTRSDAQEDDRRA